MKHIFTLSGSTSVFFLFFLHIQSTTPNPGAVMKPRDPTELICEEQRMIIDNKLKTRGFRTACKDSGVRTLAEFYHQSKQNSCKPTTRTQQISPMLPSRHTHYRGAEGNTGRAVAAADRSHCSVRARANAQDMNGDTASGLLHASWCF